MRLVILWLSVVVVCCGGRGFAEVGDVLLHTNHPLYPGEGKFQTPADCVRWATHNATSDHEKSLAIFRYLLTHQWHLHSPQEWCQPGRAPGNDRQDYEMVVYDANRGRFSYGYGLCGTVHAWNEPYWQAAGYQARRRAFPGHSNSEVFVDGRWRMFDTDMAGIVLDRDGAVAGYDEIIGDLSLLDRDQGGLPRYPFAWPSDFQGMKAGWKKVAAGGNWYKLYHGGYAAQPAVVHLRSGESLTRYAHPDAFGRTADTEANEKIDLSKRRFWHQQKDGPYRLWTFAGSEKPFHEGDKSNCRGRTSYGNAVFQYAPDLTRDTCLEGLLRRPANLRVTANGLSASDDKPMSMVFEHFSPYVICGDPVDDQDPMQNEATDGLVIEGNVDGAISVSVSPDQGQTWAVLGSSDGTFRFDATDQAKGRYGWYVRLTLKEKSSTLRSIRFVTTCQMCQTIYPHLKPGGTKVTYRSKGRSVVPVLPQLVREEPTTDRFEQRDLRSANLEFIGRSGDQRFAYQTRGPKPGTVVFRVPSKTRLVGLSGAARFRVRSPSPEGAEFHLDYSLDQGKTWRPLGEAIPPSDNEFSSGWVYGATDLEASDTSAALVRVRLNGGGYGTGLLAAELYGLRETNSNSDVSVTYGWFEGQKRRQQTFHVPQGISETTATIHTGPEIRNDFVRIDAK